MLSISLKVFLTIILILYFYIVFSFIRKQKMPIKSSILWIVFGLLFIVCIFFQPLLQEICKLIGIEKVSNFLLFCGFMALLIISLDLYKLNNQLKQKIIKLGQEIAILKNENNNK